jgi:restriction system protein
VAQHSRRKTGYLERQLAAFIAGSALLSLGLAPALGITFPDAVRLALISMVMLQSVYLLSSAASSATAGIKSPSVAKPGHANKDSELPDGFVHGVEQRAHQRIRAQAALLSRKRSACWDAGARGKVDRAKWAHEQDEFISRELLAGVPERHKEALKRRTGLIAEWRRKIEDAANDYDRKRASAGKGLDFTPGMDGFEYEAFVARILTEAGWNVWNKRDTGDQGVDVVAEGFGVIVAIQCKRYRSSVGNAAVQQIYAGRLTVSPKARAAVVTNADYTRSAKELADTTGVLLLHHDDLPKLKDLVNEPVKELNKAA